MPSRLSVEAVRDQNFRDLDAYLRGLDNACRLEDVPADFATRFTDAWRVPVGFSDATRNLLVLVDDDFPFSLPRIAVEAGPALFEWPHLEKDGVLCVVPNLTSCSYQDAVAVAKNVLASACELIAQNVS